MRCVVTAGPTFEPLDRVRRITNFSSGRLGIDLAAYLESRGHEVALLVGEQATYAGGHRVQRSHAFSTTDSLRELLRELAAQAFDAVFHAAAVSDFKFGKVWQRSPQGQMTELSSGKFSTRQGTLLAELTPTPKILAELRSWYPKARLVGWKYEVDGDQAGVLRLAEKQLGECLTDACVANGPAYGPGFGLVTGGGVHLHFSKPESLYAGLEGFIREPSR